MGSKSAAILPFQMDLALLEEIFPVLSDVGEPLFLKHSGHQIDVRLNNKTYIILDAPDFGGGADSIQLPNGVKVGTRLWIQNNRQVPMIVRVFPDYQLVIGPMTVRDARWDGRRWAFNEKIFLKMNWLLILTI